MTDAITYKEMIRLLDQMNARDRQIEKAEIELFGRPLKGCVILIPAKRMHKDLEPVHPMYYEFMERLRPDRFILSEFVPEFDSTGKRVMWVLSVEEFQLNPEATYGKFLPKDTEIRVLQRDTESESIPD